MDCFDDDAFGELVYEEEEEEETEFGQGLEHRQKQDPNCTSTQEQQQSDHRQPNGNILPELSDDDELEGGEEGDDGGAVIDLATDGGKENEDNDGVQQRQQQQESRKRSGGAIFGVFTDDSPIDWHLHIGDDDQQTKRRRVALEEAVERMTVRILSARRHQKQQQQQHQSSPATTAFGGRKNVASSQMEQRKNKLLHVPPMDGQVWWGINSVDGTFRRYLGTRRRAAASAAASTTSSAVADTTQRGENEDAALAKLIAAEERVLEQEQRQQQQQQLLHQQRKNGQSGLPNPDDAHAAPALVAVSSDASKMVGKNGAAPKFALWADKFAPRSFLDLLTEDETNRIVLLWLRLWEEYVFFEQRGTGKKGEEARSHHHLSANGPRQRSSVKTRCSLWDTLEERDRPLFEAERPKGTPTDCRMPKQKILALFGPSGVGKSSLARVAAEQAGYRPVLIPIGELQSVAELKSRLENATDSMSIDALFHNLSSAASSSAASSAEETAQPGAVGTRPCCFIVDAVEQAPADMVQFLCSWVRRARPSAHASALASVRRRPVICTCASLWNAPSLRELRTNCLPVRVQRCNRARLQRRLEQICHSEGVQIRRDQLDELLLSHGSDIRLCLNTLQFSSTRNKKGTVTAAPNRSSSNKAPTNASLAFMSGGDQRTAPGGVGSSLSSPLNSAVTVSLFDTLSAIFTLDFHADNRGIIRPLPLRARTLQTLFGQMSSDDFARLQQLVFNNFATVLKLNMAQCRFVSALFTHLDALQTLLQRAQHFVLARYIPFALALVHFHCALHVSRRLHFNLAALVGPTAAAAVWPVLSHLRPPFVEQQRENQQVMRSLRANALAANHYIGPSDVFTWFAPLLWLVLQPPVKPSLWSGGGGAGQEQCQLLQRVVELMRSFRISFVRTTGADGMARFAFEPAFDSFVRFPAVAAVQLPTTASSSSTPKRNSRTASNMTHLISEPVKQYIAQQLELRASQKMDNVTPLHQRQMDEEKNGDAAAAVHQPPQHWPPSSDHRPFPLPSSAPSSAAACPPLVSSSSVAGPPPPLFTFRHSVGSSQAVRRDIRIGTLFSAFHH